MSRNTITTEKRYFLNPQEAYDLMYKHKGGAVHNQVQTGNMFIGCDWGKENVKEALESAEYIEIGGENCKRMGHGIVVVPKGAKYMKDILFFAHDDKKVQDWEKSH